MRVHSLPREAGAPPQWHDLEAIANQMRAYSYETEIWYLAEYMLYEERGFIERNPENFTVKLTQPGRDQCGHWIEL
jgi:hypothetical protein